MRFEDGRWMCTWCGTRLDIPIEERLVVATQVENRRSILVDGHLVHECEQAADLTPSEVRRPA